MTTMQLHKKCLSGIMTLLLLFGTVPGFTQSVAMLQLQKQEKQERATMLLKDALDILRIRYKVNILFELKSVEGLIVSTATLKKDINLDQQLESLLLPLGLQHKSINETSYIILERKNKSKNIEGNKSPVSIMREDNPIIPLAGDKELQNGYVTQTESPVYVNKKVLGMVKDERGEGLPGVNVLIKGSQKGTTTNVSGEFEIDVSDDQNVLIFSYIGYISQEANIASQSFLSISLIPENRSLDEVVVVGYGTQKRKDLTGSVASIGTDQIKDLAVSRVDQALLGKIAGVQVKPVSGEPGVSPQIRIRGIGSISAGSSPLYVVDGFPTSSIETLNPNDIESMDVLKDASATAIYGSRGSNGVIIINTKRGASGKPNISFNSYYGWQKISKRPKYMNAKEQAQYHYEGLKQNNIDLGNDVSGPPGTWKVPVPPYTLGVLDGTITYDKFALDDVLRTAPQLNYQLSANGGNENIKYALSGEYLSQEGIVVGSDFKRYSLRANMDARLSKKITIKMNLNPSFIDRNLITASGPGSSANEGIVGSALGITPMYPLYNADGSYFVFVPGLDVTPNAINPAALAREITNKQKRIGLLANASLEYEILDNLKFNVLLGTVLQSSKGYRFKPQIPAFFNEPATGTDNSLMSYNWLTEYTLNYNKSFGGHNLSVLAGFTAQKKQPKRTL